MPSSSMSPRPILKAPWTPSSTPALPFAHCTPFSPHVHFPPTPILTSSQSTHSASTYDRAPIDVSPNACQLPERGERVYSCDNTLKKSYFHPRAFEACETEPLDDNGNSKPVDPSFPALVPDCSTESSDDLDSPTSYYYYPYSRSTPFPRQEEFDRALLFLPHPRDKPRKRHTSLRKTVEMVTDLFITTSDSESCLDGF